ncbi:hypothetical protein BH09BAC2_BH09BAC2_00500 [soil metagenome]
MLSLIKNKIFTAIFFCCFFLLLKVQAQESTFYTSYTTAEKRGKVHKNLMNLIHRNLSLPLNDATEEKWEDAMATLQILQYNSTEIKERITYAFDSFHVRNPDFQTALLQLAHANYPGEFKPRLRNILQSRLSPGLFILSAADLLVTPSADDLSLIQKLIHFKFCTASDSMPAFCLLNQQINEIQFSSQSFSDRKLLKDILKKSFLPNETVVYSFQRKDRNYPGMAIIRNKEGKFIRDSAGEVFNVAQLARSINNLPFYLKTGNTPQGIYRMAGFGVSMNNSIGPTPNIRMMMPNEVSVQKFFNDSTRKDSIWTIEKYRNLLPVPLYNYEPLLQSYYAGLIGRTEIISHGTTVDPEYYLHKPYYPQTPSEGCLSTFELWSGKRVASDQQLLVYALLKAGGASGYCVVIELDDKKEKVTLDELLPYIKQAEQR